MAFLLASCGVTTFQTYSFELSQVEKTGHKNDEKTIVTVLQVDDSSRYIFEDKSIKIIWEPDNQQFEFTLINKTKNSIQIPWDNAGYVDYQGNVSRIAHSGVDYAYRNNSQPPIIIPGGANLSDLLLPVVVWEMGEIIPTKTINAWTRSGLTKVNAANPLYVGKNITFLMPLIINGIQNDYLFTFKISQITVNAGDIEL